MDCVLLLRAIVLTLLVFVGLVNSQESYSWSTNSDPVTWSSSFNNQGADYTWTEIVTETMVYENSQWNNQNNGYNFQNGGRAGGGGGAGGYVVRRVAGPGGQVRRTGGTVVRAGGGGGMIRSGGGSAVRMGYIAQPVGGMSSVRGGGAVATGGKRLAGYQMMQTGGGIGGIRGGGLTTALTGGSAVMPAGISTQELRSGGLSGGTIVGGGGGLRSATPMIVGK